MITTTATATNYRYIGITDETTTCECCGKANLRSTVVLSLLDTDGNHEETAFYGSTCAARALGERSGAHVRKLARNAHWKTLQDANEARSMLAAYELPETGEIDRRTLNRAANLYRRNHFGAAWAADETWDGWKTRTLDMVQRMRAALAEAALIGA